MMKNMYLIFYRTLLVVTVRSGLHEENPKSGIITDNIRRMDK